MDLRTVSCVFVALIGIVSCQQNSIDFEDGLKQLGDQVPELKNFSLSIINVDDIEKTLKEKCVKRGAPYAVELLKVEQNRSKECIGKYINATQIEKELERVEKTDLDKVFAKYCNTWPLLYGCFDNVTLYIRQCLDNNEEESFNKTLDIIKELKDFTCFRDGYRLATFVEDGGVKCMKKQQEGVEKCVNETIGARLPSTDDFSLSIFPSFVFSDSDCGPFDKLRECVNVELEKCEDSTPANVVDSFFKFLKKQMPCNNQGTESAVLNASDLGPNGAEHINYANGSWTIVGNLALFLSMLLLRL